MLCVNVVPLSAKSITSFKNSFGLNSLSVTFFCLFTILVAIGTLNVGCGVYSFSDTAVDPRTKTVSVKDFPNLAANVQPGLSLALSEKLRTKIQRETRLQLIQTNADARFSGAIVSYYVAPAASGSNDQAQLNRLTVTVRVEYINTQTKTNWSQTFEQYENFDRNANLSSVEEALLETITDRLVDAIFNKAFSNW